MKILILDKNRRDITSLIYHYCKLGHEVYFPMPFTCNEYFDWSECCLWPTLLTWSKENPKLTNFHFHNFDKRKDLPYGEDNFLYLEEWKEPIADKDVVVKYIDLEKEKIDFDACHLTQPIGNDMHKFKPFIEKYCKNSKIINSTFNHFAQDRITWFENSCEFLPASYEGKSKKLGIKNSIGFFRHPHEIKVLGIEIEKENQAWRNNNIFSTFNHNFKVRHPEDFKIYEFLKNYFKEKGVHIENFGGNVRGVGADIRYSDVKGKTGNFITLSPRNSIKQFYKSRAILHLKRYDWAGGVEVHARSTNTPMITIGNYYNDTNMKSTFGKNLDSFYICQNVHDLIYILTKHTDDNFCKKSHNAVLSIHNQIFNNDYWKKWESFLGNLL